MSGYLLRSYIAGWERDWNDPQWLKQHSDDPLLGGIYKTRYNELYDAENKRYWDDVYKNSGTTGSQYWTRRGEYSSSGAGFSDYAFEATEAVMSLYNMKLWRMI